MKEYSEQRRIGNQGATHLESIMTENCLMHKVDESKDIGNDFFCEWANKGIPSRVPFWIQVKTTKQEVKITTISGKNNNLLRSVNISGASHFDIDEKTRDYLSGFQIPVYLFCVVLGEKENQCFYKRFTPILHSNINEKFYQVSEGNKFLAFADEKRGVGGFVRDLFVDHIRCNYKIGSLAYKNPRDLGLMQFPEKEETIFTDVLKEYKDEVDNTIKKLSQLGVIGNRSPLSLEVFTDTSSGTSISSSTPATTELLEK